MFEKMIIHENGWREFYKWIQSKYKNLWRQTEYSEQRSDDKYFHYGDNWKSIKYIDNDFILSIMPFFFDEKDIDIDTGKNRPANKHWSTIGNDDECEIYRKDDREKALIAACEKAFEIYEEQLRRDNAK
jgi:hypothetical protein